jgi:glycosyltransferase involved in cell wall biosynthesis
MNKVLIITYYWPPGSGAGVQRWLKFAKYLPLSGWEPVILTVDPEYATYPATDNSLLSEVSDDLTIYRTRATDWFRIYKKDKSKIPSAGFATNDNNSLTGKIIRFIRGNFFIPDPRKGWNKYALKEASRMIESGEIKNVITTSPPHSTQLIGLALKKRYQEINWIADLRDPWTEIYYYDSFYHTCVARNIDARYEKQVLKNADKIITVGKSLKAGLCKKLPGLEDKIEVISNGYDEADFAGIAAVNPEVFTISYIGTLSDSYPVMSFIAAINHLSDSGYRIRLNFAGAVSPGQKNKILIGSGNSDTEFKSYVSHHEAIKLMMYSSVLLLIIPDHSSNKSIITGKLFEYLASGKPVLCLGPKDGDAAEILSTTPNGRCVGYNDKEEMCRFIESYYKEAPPSGKDEPKEFNRASLTKKLVTLF